MSQVLFGIDIGGNSIKFGLFDPDGGLLEKWQIPTDRSDSGAYIIQSAGLSVRAKCEERGIDSRGILGIGVGVPGTARPDGHVIRCVNLGWTEARNAAGEMSLLTGCENVKVGNDANLAALGEQFRGAARGADDVLMLTLGTGIGGGVISGGRLVTGAAFSAGEVGHIHVNDEEALRCNCGATGCLEQYCTVDGFVRVASRLLETFSAESLLRERAKSGAGFTVRDVFDLAKEGDQIADLAVTVGCGYLGRAAATCANILNPEVIVIGGGIAAAGEIILRKMKPDFEKYAFPDCRGARLVLGELGNDAGVIGAARLVM
ncbi:MAG: ROK family protein [Lachnospiraceae bacterium]|nr:ROK family protein [Lachnospiraceae bacterium]